LFFSYIFLMDIIEITQIVGMTCHFKYVVTGDLATG